MQQFLAIFIFLSISFSCVIADSTIVREDKLTSMVEKQDIKFEYFKETTELNVKHELEITKKSLDETNTHIGYVSDRIDNISASVDRFAILTTFFGVLITIIVFFFSFKSNSEARQTVEDWLEENGDAFVNKEVQPIKENFNKIILDMQENMEDFKKKSNLEIKILKEQLEDKGNEAIENLSSRIIENDISDTDVYIEDTNLFEHQVKNILSKPLMKRTVQDYKKMIVFYIGKNNFSKAKDIIDNQLEIKNYKNKERSYIFYLKGLLEYKEKLYDNSIESFNQSIELSQDLTVAYIGLSKVYNLKKRDYTKAIEYAKKALNLDSNSYKAYITLGFAYRNIAYFEKQPKKYKSAIKYSKEAIKINPDLSSSYYTLGSIYLMKSEYLEAKKWYEIALKNHSSKEWEHNEWSMISLFTIYLLLNEKFSEELESDYLNSFSKKKSEYFLTYQVLKVLSNIQRDKYVTKEEIKESLKKIISKEKKIKFFFFPKLKYLLVNERNQDIKENLEYALTLFDKGRVK